MTLADTRPTGSQPAAPRSGPPRLRRSDRVGAATGAAFVVCILAGNSMTESVVGTDASPAGTAANLVAQAASACRELV